MNNQNNNKKCINCQQLVESQKLYYYYDLVQGVCQQCYAKQYQKNMQFKRNRIKLYPEIYEIVEGLYLGNQDAAMDLQTLQKYKIKAIQACGYFMACPFKNQLLKHENQAYMLSYKQILIGDYQQQNIMKYFSQSYEWIQKNLNEGKNVFVHCAAGVSRSPSFIIAYLMKKFQKGYQSAYDLVKYKSQYICPNIGFVKQLKEYQKQILFKN